jgi:hypothetical protein
MGLGPLLLLVPLPLPLSSVTQISTAQCAWHAVRGMLACGQAAGQTRRTCGNGRPILLVSHSLILVLSALRLPLPQGLGIARRAAASLIRNIRH